MAKRYRPNAPFSVDVKGVPRNFQVDRVDPVTKLPGYSEAELKGLAKEHRASFVEIRASFDDAPVEQATAAPGEKRTVSRSKKKAATPAAKPSVTDAADTA